MVAFFKKLSHYIIAWFLAGLLAIFIGVVSQTQFVLGRMADLGVDISLTERLSMTLYDLRYLGQFYGLFLFIALAIAFLAAGLVYYFTKFGRPIIYTIAGGVGVFVLLFAMKARFFNIHLIAGARDFPGITFQVIAGLLAGLVFAKLSLPKNKV